MRMDSFSFNPFFVFFRLLIKNNVVPTHVTISSKIRLWISIDPNPKRKNENPNKNNNTFKYFGKITTKPHPNIPHPRNIAIYPLYGG
jgi:hypothetical protein